MLFLTKQFAYFYSLVCRLGATTTILRERLVEAEGAECQRKALEILIRKVPENQEVGHYIHNLSFLIPRCYEWNTVLIIEKNHTAGNVTDIKFEKKQVNGY